MIPVQLYSSERSLQSDLPSHLAVWLTQLPSKHSNSSDRHRTTSRGTENNVINKRCEINKNIKFILKITRRNINFNYKIK